MTYSNQDAFRILRHLGTLPAHIQASVNQQLKILSLCTSFQALTPKPVAQHGVVVSKVQELALSNVEPHPIGLCSLIQPVQVPHARDYQIFRRFQKELKLVLYRPVYSSYTSSYTFNISGKIDIQLLICFESSCNSYFEK